MSEETKGAPSRARSRVLLVEDNEITQLIVKTMLRKLNHQVVVVGDGQQALDALTNDHFDLVLLDCCLPVLDGYEVTRRWRQVEAELGARLPIIAMTAANQEENQQRCMAVGMDDFLPKPVNLEGLDAKLRFWLEGKDKGQSSAQVSA